jgi:DUF1365 family protein
VRSLWWRYRFFTAGVVARIHWQALKLAMRRVPFHQAGAAAARTSR